MNFTTMSNNIIAKKYANLLHFYNEILNVNEIITSIPNNKKNYTFQIQNQKRKIEELVAQEKQIHIQQFEDVKNIDDLKKQLLHFNDVSFQSTSSPFVFGDGNPNADLLILGDAPTFDDVQSGKPFMGTVGQLLDRMLSFININRTHCYMSNVTFWQKTPNYQFAVEEIDATLSIVHQLIRLINPKIILTLGAIATNALLKKPQGITQLRGKFHFYPLNPDIMILPTFHPISLLNSPQSKQLSWRDLLILKSKCSEMELCK